MDNYEERVFKFLTDAPEGLVKDLNEVQEKERFIKACKHFINLTGQAEFNSSYTKIRKIK